MSFKLTYSTMFNPPAELHQRYEEALTHVRAQLGKQQGLFINGDDRIGDCHRALFSPIDARCHLGDFAQASASDVDDAFNAAKTAFASWRKTPAQQRIAIIRRAGELIEERVYHIAAALSLEVGKNRMEALGEAQETADFFYGYCDSFMAHDQFDHRLPNDPLTDFVSTNRSVMKPYGAWLVITPFNFPFALAGGPVAAALVTGNTVVLKGASGTPWAGRLLADCLRDAGLPPGVFNYLSGASSEIGAALVSHPQVAGITFTGSYEAGMSIARAQLGGAYPRPCIAEMGGKNACIVTAHADLNRAALGILRSAFGMGGQKCSALSRLLVDKKVAAALIEKLTALMATMKIGDPTLRENYLGPVANKKAYHDYVQFCQQLNRDGARILCGGQVIAHDEMKHGYFVQPTLSEAPLTHALWQHEMFLPILMLHRFESNDEAMQIANQSNLGLTAGVFGNDDEVAWFFDHIEAGVCYANRPQGATTGAWPGYQPFGGWKGSGNTGKAIASFYYLANYLREQSQTVVAL